MVRVNDWSGRGAAEASRQWPRILELAHAAAHAPFIGVVLLGSFARGEADDLSDVDFIAFTAEGTFDEAWARRHELHRSVAACWDYPRPPGGRDVAAHRWLTTDVVLFDGLIATPSGTRVADPLHVLVGDDSLPSQLVRLPPDEPRQPTDDIVIHEIEQLYGQLKLATRAYRRQAPKSA